VVVHQPVFNSPYRDSGKFGIPWLPPKRNPLHFAKCLETRNSGVLPSQWSALSHYAGRVLLLSGEYDSKYTAAAKRMHALFQDAALRSIAGAGHQLLMEKPSEVAQAVADFLNQIV
jgi:2-succinyl-6-hydroxy-2,4-cyclohexadiene-1-carboxylate synthase